MFIVLMSLLMGLAWAEPKIQHGKLEPLAKLIDIEELNQFSFNEHRQHSRDLRKVKYLLISGELELAKVHLTKLTSVNSALRPVVNRYLGIIHFIEGDYAKSHDYLSREKLGHSPYYSKVCTLLVLNEIILNKKDLLERQWKRCRRENSHHFRQQNLTWLDTLVKLKLSPKVGVTKAPFERFSFLAMNNDELKILLKLSLYLNQEKMMVEALPELTLDQLQDPEIRELAGQIFFRTGALANAYRFVEDLKSPNSENIKGNLYVLRNKYELAYAQFKLALEQKQNSQNALERLVPLAWLLGDSAGGNEYSERIIATPENFANKLALVAAFRLQKGDFKGAESALDGIARKSKLAVEIDVTQLYSFVALMENNTDKIKKYAGLSCQQYDLVNCWLLFQISQWDAFPATIRRDDKVNHSKLWEKLTQEDLNEPLKEKIFVNQLDIEEMDDKLIQLIPKKSP